jgi:hypothetical protein
MRYLLSAVRLGILALDLVMLVAFSDVNFVVFESKSFVFFGF